MFFFIAILGLALIIFNRRWLSLLGEAMAQVFAGLCLALVAGVLLGNALGESSAGDAGYSALFTLLLAFPSVWLMGRLGTTPQHPALIETPRAKSRAKPALAKPDLPGAPQWDALAQNAPGHAARIAVARRSAARLCAAAASPTPPEDPAEVANLIKKHVPQAIESTLTNTATQDSTARAAALETLIDTLEDIAAEAERLLGRRHAQGIPEVALLRRRLEASSTPF